MADERNAGGFDASGMNPVAGPLADGFGYRLAEHVERRQSQIVLGLDPDPALLWPHALLEVQGRDSGAPPAVRAARAVLAHCRLVMEAVAPECVAVKPQVACFERLGAPGWEVLGEVIEFARGLGLLVIADAKRGDIDLSARAYGQAFVGDTATPFGTVPGLGADALTVNPWLGTDAMQPIVDIARERGRGVFVLVRNSNPGADELQERQLDDGTVSDAVARMVFRLGAQVEGALTDVGAVVGATAPERLAGLRELMPRTPFLLPGVGAQGGRVQDLAPAFGANPASGLIAVSRGLVYAHRMTGGDPAEAARREAARLREQASALTSRSR
ncbi:MAG: orotidine-5'-phosphate decarboxylase [Solirubrobacteraceae bacterium]